MLKAGGVAVQTHAVTASHLHKSAGRLVCRCLQHGHVTRLRFFGQSLASIKAADGSVALYSVKLPTGKATPRGSFGGQVMVIDIAIPLNQL